MPMLIIIISRPQFASRIEIARSSGNGLSKKDGRVVVLPSWGLVVMLSLMKVYSFRLCKLLIQ